MAAELAMQATNERIKAARTARAEAEQGMNNAREMERDLRQQLANLEVEFSEQSGQVAALLERLRRQEDLTTAGLLRSALHCKEDQTDPVGRSVGDVRAQPSARRPTWCGG